MTKPIGNKNGGIWKKLTIEEVDRRLLLKNIKRISEYKNTFILSDVICLVCGKKWKTKIKNILCKNGHGCGKCGKNEKLTNEEIDNRLKGGNIIRIGDVKNAMVKIKFKCIIHDLIWSCRPSGILNHNQGCPKCGGKEKLTNNVVDEKLKGSKFKRVGESIDSFTPIEMRCLLCNKHFHIQLRRFKTTHKDCNYDKSKSENNVNILIKKHIKYTYFQPHKPIFINNKKFIPDFYLEINNKKIFIEYNGRQHYMPVTFNGKSKEDAEKCFEIQKIRDIQLREYCKENNFILLEIPYYWKDEETIKQLTLLNEIA